MITYRPYQSQAIAEARSRIAHGKRKLVLIAPTGSGKTIVASGVTKAATEKHKNVLFVAHRKELIDQASRTFDSLNIPHGVIMANHWRRRFSEGVQIASVQTWRSWAAAADKVSAEEDALKKWVHLPWSEIPWRTVPHPLRKILFMKTYVPDIVFVDECHLSITTSYRNILNRFPQSVVLGLTATPIRADGKPLSDLYQDKVVVSTVPELIRQGYLVTPRHFAPATPNLTKIGIKNHDYDESELAEVMDRPDLVGSMVDEWLIKAKGRPTLIFAINRRHSKNIVAEFLSRGISAEHIDGESTQSEREGGLARLESGETQVISNVGLFTEGTDLPYVSCIVLARPTKSLALYLQQGGRGLRIHPPTKKDCIILDHAGCFHAHGPLDHHRDWALDDQTKKRPKKPATPDAKVCPECSTIFAPNRSSCPHCGWSPQSATFVISVDNTKQLQEMDPYEKRQKLKQEEQEAQTMPELIALAKARGYKPAWAYHLFEARQQRQIAFASSRHAVNRG